MTRGLRGLAALALALPVASCDALVPPSPDLMAEPDVERPAADVQLPPVPRLDMVDRPRQYEDGSWSVTGLWLSRAEQLGEALRVTAVVEEIYVCDVPTDAEETGAVEADEEPRRDVVRPGCLRPHLRIADDRRSRRTLLVTGYEAWHWEPQLEPGQRVTVEGRFQQQARGFVSSDDGLLIADAFVGEGIEPLPEPDEDAGP